MLVTIKSALINNVLKEFDGVKMEMKNSNDK